MSTKTKKIIKGVVNVLLWIFLIFAVLVTIMAFTAQANKDGFPKIGNTCFFIVQTDSMAEKGGFYAGDLIISKTLTNDERKQLKVGDVITYYMDLTPDNDNDDPELNSHRIVEVSSNANGEVIYYTMGDHNPARDTDPVRWDEVHAIWTGKSLRGIGKAINFLQSSIGFLVCIVIPLFLFFAYELFLVIKTAREMKNKDTRRITKDDEEMIKQRAIEEFLARQSQAHAQNIAPQDSVSGESKNEDNDNGKSNV